jgi:hypothetical protein
MVSKKVEGVGGGGLSLVGKDCRKRDGIWYVSNIVYCL